MHSQTSKESTAIAIIAASFLARLLLLDAPELLCQEAYYWNYAKHLALGYIDHPPMVAWLIAASSTLLGTNEFAMRLPSLLLSAGTGWMIYRFTERIFTGHGLTALMLFAGMPYFFGTGFFISPDSPLTFFWAAAVFAIYDVLSRPIPKKFCSQWLLIGLLIGLGMISKYTIVLVGLSTLILIASKKELRPWLLRLEPYLGAIITALCFSPVIYWNATNDWASFAFQGPERFKSPPEFGTPAYLLHLLALATPPGAILAYFVLAKKSISDSFYRSFAQAFALVPIAIFFLFSIRQETKIIWAGPALLPLLPGIALLLTELLATPRDSLSKIEALTAKFTIPFLILSVAGHALYFTYLGVGIPGLGYKASMNRLIGWESLGAHSLETVRAHHIDLIVGMDKHYTAAELGFYVRKAALKHSSTAPEIAGRPIFGLDGLMWHIWLPKEDHFGKDVLLVARGKSDLEFPELSAAFESLDPIEEFRSTANGKPSGQYFLRIGRHFKRTK